MEENKDIQANDANVENELENKVNEQMDSTNHDEPIDEMTVLQNKLNEVNDKYLRLVAEFDNYRKRMAKERVELIKNASEETIVSLLEVLDDTDRASVQIASNQDIEQIKEGVTLVFNKFRKILTAKGLEEIVAVNEEFNTDLHEAITEIPAPTPDLTGKVVDVISKGYKLNDKLIRHAKVVVGK